MMKEYTLSYWNNFDQRFAKDRKEVSINSISDFAKLLGRPQAMPVKNKQKAFSRRWQESIEAREKNLGEDFLITLDYDSSSEKPLEVHEKLKSLGVNHCLFTTWSHKTISTIQKNNNGLNCFKVIIDITAKGADECNQITHAIGDKVGHTIKKTDDISRIVFFGGAHPDFIDQYELYVYDQGNVTKDDLLSYVPVKMPTESPVVDEFAEYIATQGQQHSNSIDRVQKALSVIEYEPLDGGNYRDMWLHLLFSLHSTGNNDFFEVFDNWCLEKCGSDYDREENEKTWYGRETLPAGEHDLKNRITLQTLWFFEKHFRAKLELNAVRSSKFTFFDEYASTEPEKIKFLIKDLLVEDSIGFLVGDGGVGKSSMSLEVAKSIASGNFLFGDERYPTSQGSVLLINKEDSEIKVHNQIKNLIQLDCSRMNKSFQDFSVDPVEPSVDQLKKACDMWRNVARPSWSHSNIRLTDEQGEKTDSIDAMIGLFENLQTELVTTGRPPLKLIVFDPFNMWHGGDQNSQKDMSYAFSAFQQIQKKLGVTVLIVHHKNKSNGFSGSHVIRDSGRFMWYLQFNKDTDKIIDLYIEKHNDAKAKYTALSLIRTDKGLLDLACNYNNGEDETNT